MKYLQSINCVETPSGFLLTWKPMEHANIIRTTVYGINDEGKFIIKSPITPTGRCLVAPENYNLLKSFKLAVVLDNGEVEESDVIDPQRMKRAERVLLRDMRRRFNTKLRVSPIGIYPCAILFRRIDGAPCELCGSNNCSGRGGTGASDYCPRCLGTGIDNPYVLYNKKELFLAVTPKEDAILQEEPGLQRRHVVMTFQSSFDLLLKEDDYLVTKTEVFRVVKQEVRASMGGVPAFYTITAQKLAPEDPKYKAMIALAKDVNEH